MGHSPTQTMGPTIAVCILGALLAPCFSLSVDPDVTLQANSVSRPLGPLGPISPYSPTYLPLYRPITFQPRLICSSCSCSNDFWCASYCPECATDAYCASCSCLTSLGVKYKGCAPLYGGLTNAYSPVYWCSTKVDINGFHIRGPFTKPGKYVGYCDHTCPKVNFVF